MTWGSGPALVAAFALAAAGCTGPADESTTAEADSGTAPTVTTVVTVESEATTTVQSSAAAPAARYGSFRMPSKNIGCAYLAASGTLRCDILSGLDPPPDRACELDWVGVVMGKTGSAEAQCAGDTVYSNSAPILSYGRRWRRGGLTCLSGRSGLRCRSRDGHRFSLARSRWSVS